MTGCCSCPLTLTNCSHSLYGREERGVSWPATIWQAPLHLSQPVYPSTDVREQLSVLMALWEKQKGGERERKNDTPQEDNHWAIKWRLRIFLTMLQTLACTNTRAQETTHNTAGLHLCQMIFSHMEENSKSVVYKPISTLGLYKIIDFLINLNLNFKIPRSIFCFMPVFPVYFSALLLNLQAHCKRSNFNRVWIKYNKITKGVYEKIMARHFSLFSCTCRLI